LDDEKTQRDPSYMTKLLWKKLKTLRPSDEKNGARYVIDGKQIEIRAIRNQDFWLKKDLERDVDGVQNELSRGESGVVALFPSQ